MIRVKSVMDWPVIRSVQSHGSIHDCEEPFDAMVQTHSLEETVVEKLRAILQQARALKERGRSMSTARDHYDLWRILGTYRDGMAMTDYSSLLREKCAVTGVGYDCREDFFDNDILSYVKDRWRDSLGPLLISTAVL